VSLVLVAGTGTEVGKTYVTAAALRTLREDGVAVAARKPVQSFDADDVETDADVLAAASGEPTDVVCPPHRRFATPMAPPMAAEVLGLPSFTIRDLVDDLTLPSDTLVFVESAGGVRSPLAEDGDTVTLADALRPNAVVLVADAGLGTINAVRLCVDALNTHHTIVYLNRFDEHDELHARNRDWLLTREGLEVVTDPEALAKRLLATR
jgi:dethiobiotin synthetase